MGWVAEKSYRSVIDVYSRYRIYAYSMQVVELRYKFIFFCAIYGIVELRINHGMGSVAMLSTGSRYESGVRFDKAKYAEDFG